MSTLKPIRKTIEKLRSLADALEEIEGNFPQLSWDLEQREYEHHPLQRNPLTELRPYATFSCEVDKRNVGKATRVSFGKGFLEDVILVFFEHDNLPPIRVMQLWGLSTSCLCRAEGREFVRVISMLPESLRLEIYKHYVSLRRKKRAQRDGEIERLRKKLRCLEEEK